MLSEPKVSAILLGVAAAGLLAIVSYNLWIAPPAQGLEAVRLEGTSSPTSSAVKLDLPVTPDAEHPLDLNAATAEELTLLPGIGETLAQRILQYREENGPFQSPEDLLKVEGIGEKTFAELRDRVSILPSQNP